MNRRTFILACAAPLLPAFSGSPLPDRTAGQLSTEDARFDRMIDSFCRECARRSPAPAAEGRRPAARFAGHVRAGLGGGGIGRGRAHAYLGRLRSVDRARLSGGRRADFDRAERALLGSLAASGARPGDGRRSSRRRG